MIRRPYRNRRTVLRAVFVTILLILFVGLALSKPPTRTSETRSSPAPLGESQELTAVTSDNGRLWVFDAEGNVVYSNDSLDGYFDIDRAGPSQYSVTYIGFERLSSDECPREAGPGDCRRNLIVKENISTGETTVLYSTVLSGKWHDVDHVNGTRYVVADNVFDMVRIINVETGLTEWAWSIRTEFPISGGGTYPNDWTHINDVEYIGNGTIMASLRNFDQVVFVDMETGYRPSMTLGEEDDHSRLYEQHNPDYIPESHGGPSVVVASSEEHQVEEYTLEDGRWVRVWAWTDSDMVWPRDADRLPSNNTLITDSRGDRVIEVNESGSVVWSVKVRHPYEAERLTSENESGGGYAAEAAGLESAGTLRTGNRGEHEHGRTLVSRTKNIAPGKLISVLTYVAPFWFGFEQFLYSGLILVSAGSWLLVELLWSPLSIRWENN